MSLPVYVLLMCLVDLLIVAGTFGAILYVVKKRVLRSDVVPMTGAALVLLGLTIASLGFLAEGLRLILRPVNLEDLQNLFVGAWMPYWLYWAISRTTFIVVMIGLTLAVWQHKRSDSLAGSSDRRVREAQGIIMQCENRFRALFETTTNSIFCFTLDPPMPVTLPIDEQIRRSHDAILTECNKAFANSLNCNEPADVIGMRMGMLEANKDERAHDAYFGAFIKSDYRLSDYELIYKNPQGEDRAVKSSLTGIIRNGLVHRFWGAESNILDLRQTKAALQRRHLFEELVAKISSSLVIAVTEEADQTLTRSLEKVCRYFQADRATIFWMNREIGQANAAYSWGVPGDEFGPEVALSDFPIFAEKARQKQVIRVDDAESLPDELRAEREAILRRNVKSFVAVPLVVGGEIVGVTTITCKRARRAWSDEDVNEINVFADLFANYVQRLKSRQALDEALSGLKRATKRLEAENVYLREEIERTNGFDEIIGQSPAILYSLKLVEQVANTNTPVLLLGETGTGKELIARAIHEHSDRRTRPLVKVNCAALPASLIESELFGYDKGAFTGADKKKHGRFDLADGSTLFLDEIAEIPLDLQAKLLRALQEGEIERLGGSATIKVDVRLIAATNRDLSKAVQDGEFRSDLFYRINTFPIELPPLRDRGDDIQMLTEHFVKLHSPGLGRDVSAISADMMERLRRHLWPGNVRELESVIQRALISSTGPILELPTESPDSLAETDSESPRILSTTIADLRVVERDHILSVLQESDWKIAGRSGAAAKLGMPPSTLRSKMKKLSITRPD